MEIGEAVTAPFEKLMDKDPKCPGQPNTTKWKAKINGLAGKKCSGTALYQNMTAKNWQNDSYLGPPQAFVAKPAPGTKWKLSMVKETAFPVQAHHIIPKNHLPDHPVCTFLAQKFTDNEHYQLTVSDAPYSTDYQNNGYCLPYATPLAEWKKLSDSDDDGKLKLCFDVMDQTRRQLHQGSHRVGPYEEVADDEEAEIHQIGYLSGVDQLLNIVQGCAQDHVQKCEICNGGKDSEGKIKVLPRQKIVEHMDQVSGIVKLLVDANRTFISKPAAEWGKRKRLRLPAWLRGK